MHLQSGLACFDNHGSRGQSGVGWREDLGSRGLVSYDSEVEIAIRVCVDVPRYTELLISRHEAYTSSHRRRKHWVIYY
jgi:hypothetical protein